MESFGEDCKKMQPDSFFSYFVDFLESFQVAKKENEAAKKKKLEEEKRKKLEQKVCFIYIYIFAKKHVAMIINFGCIPFFLYLIN